jgi:hypothetical protein
MGVNYLKEADFGPNSFEAYHNDRCPFENDQKILSKGLSLWEERLTQFWTADSRYSAAESCSRRVKRRVVLFLLRAASRSALQFAFFSRLLLRIISPLE